MITYDIYINIPCILPMHVYSLILSNLNDVHCNIVIYSCMYAAWHMAMSGNLNSTCQFKCLLALHGNDSLVIMKGWLHPCMYAPSISFSCLYGCS